MKSVSVFWEECRRKCPEISSDTVYQVWHFGNTPEMARRLADLVVSGKKTATSSLVEYNEKYPGSNPEEGGYSIVTDHAGEPICVVQTIQVKKIAFSLVDAQFAFDEGEGDRTLEYWRRGHRDFFTREALEFGLGFDDDSLICCERFRLVYPKNEL